MIGTKAIDSATGSNYAKQQDALSITDTVSYDGSGIRQDIYHESRTHEQKDRKSRYSKRKECYRRDESLR